MVAAIKPLLPPPPPARPIDLDPAAIELVQRARIILDVSGLDLEVAEAALGPFHEATVFFRATLDEARRSWERLRARHGSSALTAALEASPQVVLTLGEGQEGWPRVVLIEIAGATYAVDRVPGTDEAPAIWRLARLPDDGDGPYHVCRLADGSLSCDCAQWIYQLADTEPDAKCKHMVALRSLGWI